MVHVLFVCLGNICRSPLAEAIFNDKVRKRKLNNEIHSDSAGTSRYHINEPPDVRSLEVARKNNIDIQHLGRQISAEDFANFDYILAMDEENLQDILQLQKKTGGKVRAEIHKMLDFDDQRSGNDVPDPYFGGPDGFDHVFNLLDQATNNFLEYTLKKHRQ